MNQHKHNKIALIILVFIFVHINVFGQNIMKESDTPDFNIINKKGNKIKKVDFRGKVIVLIIASSWSIEFLEDFDQIKSLQKETWNKDVVFLYAIADVQNNWESFLREYSAPKLDNSLENTYILPISSPYCNDCFMTNHFKQEEIPSYYVFSKSGDLIGENIPRKSILTGMKSLILGARNLSYK